MPLTVNKKDTKGSASLSKFRQVAVVFLLFKELWPSLEVKAIVERRGAALSEIREQRVMWPNGMEREWEELSDIPRT